jgi:hypothetical protein
MSSENQLTVTVEWPLIAGGGIVETDRGEIVVVGKRCFESITAVCAEACEWRDHVNEGNTEYAAASLVALENAIARLRDRGCAEDDD